MFIEFSFKLRETSQQVYNVIKQHFNMQLVIYPFLNSISIKKPFILMNKKWKGGYLVWKPTVFVKNIFC